MKLSSILHDNDGAFDDAVKLASVLHIKDRVFDDAANFTAVKNDIILI